MDKMKMQTPDITESNIEKIGQLFPNCLTERIREDGKVERAIDFDQLRQELSREIVEGARERYQFSWPDKRKTIRLANSPSNMTLRPCRAESIDFDNTENLYIEGDNLEVLKLIRENYLGRVKVIYVDPPYNTGHEFVYNDDFSVGSQEWRMLSGEFSDDSFKLSYNTDSNGRFHTDWVNMIYARLKVSRDLLSDDGVIFISIDDNEIDNLCKVGNEIFGESNFINVITVKTKVGGVSGSSEGKSLKDATEFICIWAKNKNSLLFNTVYVKTKLFDRIRSYEAEGKSWKYTSVIVELGNKTLLCVDEKKGMKFYGYKNLQTSSIQAFATEKGISVEDVYNRYADRIFQTTNAQSSVRQTVMAVTSGYDYPMYSLEYTPIKGKNEGQVIEVMYKGEQRRMMMFLSDAVERIDNEYYYLDKISTLWDDIDYNNLSKEGDIEFPNGKKPIKLLQRILQLASGNDSFVLDFFSGSSSTAHAVMQLNAEDGGTRRFIMVQLQEPTEEGSDARNAGFGNICEIGKERIRRAGKKILEEYEKSQTVGGLFDQAISKPALDVGFRVLKLDSSNMDDVYYRPEESSETTLFVDNIKPDRTPEDLLFQVMLECNLPLSAKIESKKIAGKDVFSVNNGYLMACFDADINEVVIKEVAKMKPYYFILRDSSLSSDNVADNFDQIFQAYSKETIRRVL